MRFKSLDLNLLVALDVLLDEQSVTRAAKRLNVSQPAMSAALSRLREHFNEPLFILHGKRMIPTAAAQRIRDPLKALLRDAEALVIETTHFDPATSKRRFKIATSDYLLAVIFPSLTRKLSKIAPGISMDFMQPTEEIVQLLDQGQLDLIITPENYVSQNHPTELLFEERYVVAGWSKNPALKNKHISEEDFFAADHVITQIGSMDRTSFAELHLCKIHQKRRVDMRVSSFLCAPEMVVESLRLTVMHERLAALYAQRLDITTAPLPFKFPVMREMVQFHESRKHDTGLRWLIDEIKNMG